MGNMEKSKFGSIDIGRAALKVAVTASREEENEIKKYLIAEGIQATGVDFGGEFVSSIVKIVERAVVAAQREGIVPNNATGAGPVAGAASGAIEQVKNKAIGFNVGGKIGIARYHEHLCVAVYMGVGVLNLNELAVGLAHRIVRED
jgi:hypothetical protein